MQLPPNSVLVNWPIPNYEDPETQGLSLVIINVIFMTLISVAVPLRLYGRYTNKGRLGWDDLNMAIAYIFSLALGIVVILANVRYQWNRHLWDVEFTMFQPASIVAMVAKVLFTLAATFARASLICFYFRLIKDTGYNLFKWILWAAMAYNIAIGITFVILAVFLCTPVEAYWVFPLIKSAKCLDEGPVTLIAGVLNCISDLLVTLLPIPIVMRLNMPLKQRIGVTILLSLGLVVTIAGVVRTYYIWKTLMDTYDETWDSMPLYICATVEIDLAVLCGCAPALKPYFAPMVSHVTEMISSVAHHSGSHSGASRHTRLHESAITRSTVVSQKHRAKTGKEEDKIPMHFVTVDGRSSDESRDDANSDHHNTDKLASNSSTPGRSQRSCSRASSQRTILPSYHDNAINNGTSGWDIEEGCENDDSVPEIHNIHRRNLDHDVEKADWNTDWRVSKGVKAGWI